MPKVEPTWEALCVCLNSASGILSSASLAVFSVAVVASANFYQVERQVYLTSFALGLTIGTFPLIGRMEKRFTKLFRMDLFFYRITKGIRFRLVPQFLMVFHSRRQMRLDEHAGSSEVVDLKHLALWHVLAKLFVSSRY